MKLTQSQIVSDSIQIDGRRRIHELHIDSDGVEYNIFYVADKGFNAFDELSNRTLALEDFLTALNEGRDALRLLEKERAELLLSMPDDHIQKILYLKPEEVEYHKDELEKQTGDVEIK